jgi:hypothetical protein
MLGSSGSTLWAIGAGILAWLLVDDLIEEMHAASRHFTLTGERSISGIPLPTGSEVNLDDYNRLVSVRLPAAATVTIEGTAWGGNIEFFPADPPLPAGIRSGVPATETAFDGVPCRAGQPVGFTGSRHLRFCTLAQDISAQAEIADSQGKRRHAHLACAADRAMELQPGEATQFVERCTLAEIVAIAGIPCAKGTEIEIFNGRLISCTLAAAQMFSGVEIPSGSILHLTNTASDRAVRVADADLAVPSVRHGPAIGHRGLALPRAIGGRPGVGPERRFCRNRRRKARRHFELRLRLLPLRQPV